ncbi:tetraspanin-8-like [Actinia tenebrosa]|uniref:Tetraspanin n=1 Tax=Actinia tenebrosa TaxID=6105 RepID=A0A6P8J0Y7_ACTTE|nr:tetraspanin-8-like [Actinia tenebrosa]
MVDGGTKCVKYLVFFFNFLFFVFGIVLLGFGAYAEIRFGPYVIFTSTNYATGSHLLIAVGVIISVISFFGCCGAWKENRFMLIIFFVLLFVLLGLEIAAAVLGYKDRDEIEADIKKDIENKIKEYPTKYEKEIDDLQKEFKCCGASGPEDWISIKKLRFPPDSCNCEGVSKDQCSTFTLNYYYKAGCAPALKTYFYDKLLVIAALAITLIVIQILGMVFAMFLICRISS